ncbi:MAG: ATP-binding protein [Pseudomonadota bacterium]
MMRWLAFLRPKALRPQTLRWRLALGLALGVLVLGLLVRLAAGRVVAEEMDEVFDSALEQISGRILALVVVELALDGAAASQAQSQLAPQEAYLIYAVRGPDGRILRHTPNADLAPFAQGPVAGFRNDGGYRIYSPGAQPGRYTIEVAEPLDKRREAVEESTRVILASVLLLFPFSVVAMLWFVARALRPVDRLRAEVTARDGHDLRPVTETGLPQELAVIAAEVNQLLARVTRTLEAERAFTTNSAHELRTPIAAALAQTQRLLAEVPPGPLADRAGRVEEALHRLARLSEKLMQLARAEGAGVLMAKAQDMRPVVLAVAEDFRRGGLGARLSVRVPDSGADSRMDPDACAILLRNLIENAARHGAAGQPVVVTLAENGAFWVVNDGPVLPPEVLARLHHRFERGAGTGTGAGAGGGDGAGLGLAIADTIARAAGGELRLHSPARGHLSGFEAEFLPAGCK